MCGYEAKFLIRVFSNRDVRIKQITDAREDHIVIKMDYNAAEENFWFQPVENKVDVR